MRQGPEGMVTEDTQFNNDFQDSKYLRLIRNFIPFIVVEFCLVRIIFTKQFYLYKDLVYKRQRRISIVGQITQEAKKKYLHCKMFQDHQTFLSQYIVTGIGIQKSSIVRFQGSKGIRHVDKLSTTFPMMIYKITPFIDYNLWLKRLNT